MSYKYLLQRNFFHKIIIHILQNGIKRKDLQCPALDADQGELIGNGFCFSLVMDWLANDDYAQKFYWPANMNLPKGTQPNLLSHIESHLTKSQYEYYRQIATQFCKYCKQMEQIQKNKDARIQFSVNEGGRTKVFEVLENFTAFIQSNFYSSKFCPGLYFELFGSEECSSGTLDIGKFFSDVETKLGQDYYVMLLNIFLYCPSKELFRHSVGIQKTVNARNEKDTFYAVFDPSFGVYVTDNLAIFLEKHLLDRYALQKDRLNQRLVYLQYHAVRRPGNFYHLYR